MVKHLLNFKKPTIRLGRLVRAVLMPLIGLAVLPVTAQFNGSDNYVFISGQITNDVTGAPIADHDIYILSDSSANNGFEHYAIVKTDVNGFFRDTIVTQLNDGSVNLSLFDFENNLHEKIRYYRFNWSDNYQMIVDFEIHDPNTNTTLQANFVAEKDTISGHENSVIFRDHTYGYKVKSWIWDFGDSTFSTVQDPTHIYAKPGIYLVKLTVSSYPPAFEYHETSTIIKQVQVGGREYYNLGGQVFTGLFPPIDYGLAYLYQITDNEQFIPIDTAVIDTLDGLYYFHQLIEGKYTTKVRLSEESSYYGQYIPTYLGNTLAWNKASVVNLNDNNFTSDVNLIESVGIPYGKGQILGQMMYDTSLVNNPLVPAEDVEVVLLGVEGAHITCKMSEVTGLFEFADLAYGTYQLYPDVAGVFTNTMFITISEDKPVAGDFSLVITPEAVTYLGIGEPEQDFGTVNSLYPNPAKDLLNLDMDIKHSSGVSIVIIDAAGRCVQEKEYSLIAGSNHLSININNLDRGFYQIILTSIEEGTPVFTTKFIKIN